MRPRTVSRQERRAEKKQAILFIAVVLAVSLVSFVLGVMVGRVSSRPQVVEVPPAPPERVVVAVPPPQEKVPEPAGEAAPADLTFFDALPKGEQPPMGSGINLPPEKKAPKEETAAPRKEKQPSAEPRPASSAAKGATSPAPQERSTPAAASQGRYVLQAASFKDAADARTLRERLSARGYPCYVEEADLGSKGVWHRVLVGPYESDQSASSAASRLLAEEKISALIRKR